MKLINKNIWYLFTFIIAVGLIIFLLMKPDITKSKSGHAEQTIPTVFVHGFKGGPRSFNYMLARFQDQYHWGRKMMICRVDKNGHVHIYGYLQTQKNPFIQVIFENNRASIQDTTNWFKEIMEILFKRYQVKEVNVVGHSMGGLVLTNYIEQSMNTNNHPKILKLITIGSPFKGIASETYYQNVHNTGPAIYDLKANSPFLKSLLLHKSQFNPQIRVLSIAGVMDNPEQGDGVVSLNSALGLEDIVPKEHLEKKIIYDPQATHSGLHEHQKVDQFIGNFLWGYVIN